MSHALLERGLRPAEDFVLLDAGSTQTLSWRRRWDSLTLFASALTLSETRGVATGAQCFSEAWARTLA